jgi:hypothetical protein
MKRQLLRTISSLIVLLSITALSFSQNQYSKAPNRLNGDYTIGSGGNYLTITDAVNDLDFRGVNDTVNFILTDETYPSETFPIEITEYYGASATCPVTIKPADGVVATIEGDASSIFRLISVSYFNFDGSGTIGDGRNLIISNTNSTTNCTVMNFSNTLGNTSEHITIQNCVIKSAGFTNITHGINVTGANGGNDNLIIRNNVIGNVRNGIFLYGVNTLNNITNAIIEDNIIGNDTLPLGKRGIIAMHVPGITINNNTITGMPEGNGIAQQAGIKVEGHCTNSTMTISNNRIGNFKYNSTVFSCIGIDYGVIHDSESRIFNNVIYDIQAPARPVTYNNQGYDLTSGIYLDEAENVKLYNNTISLDGACLSPSSEGNSANVVIGGLFSGTIDMRNNIFYNNQTVDGTPVPENKTYAVVCYSDISIFSNIDNNEYYASGVNPQIAYYNSSDVATLNDWQTLTTQDANSVSVEPFFESNYSLSSEMNCQLDNLGTPLPEVTHDISGTLRNVTTPDIGAYEFESTTPAALSVADISACAEMPVPAFTASPTGDAYWYADETLTDLLFIGDEFISSETEAGTYNYYVADVLGSCVSPYTEASLTLDDCSVSDFSWLEDFENNGDLPEIWSHFILDAEGGNSFWTITENSYSGTYAASHIWTLSGYNADNWLVSPKLVLSNIQGTPILSFYEKKNFSAYYDYSGIWVSTGSGNPEDGDYIELYEANQTNQEYEKRTLSLSDYDGQDIYIAFVYQGEYAHSWYVDDIYVYSAFNLTYGTENAYGAIAATIDGESVPSDTLIEEGSDIIFTATPNTDYQVAEWYVNGSPQSVTDEQFTYSILQENINVSVEFEEIPAATYTVTFNVDGGNGSLVAEVGGTQIYSGDDVEEGSDIVFTATPDNNYEVFDWYVNGSPQSVTNEQFTYSDLQENINVTVEFEEIPAATYTVTFNVDGGNGSLMAEVGGTQIYSGDDVEEGSDIVFTATPDNNYEVFEWYVNGSPQSITDEIFTYENLQEDISVTVEFDVIQNIAEHNSNFEIYPNPTTGIIFIDFSSSVGHENVKNVEITDISGKTIQQFNNLTIDLTNQATGIYFLKITTNEGHFTEKIIKQ